MNTRKAIELLWRARECLLTDPRPYPQAVLRRIDRFLEENGQG